MFRFLRPYQLVVDAAIAIVYFVVVLSLNSERSSDFLLKVALAIALLLRRLSPPVSLGIAWVAALAQMYVAQLTPQVADLAILGVLYSTAAYGGRVLKWLGLVSVGVGAVLGAFFLVFTGNAYQFGLTLGSNVLPSGLAQALVQFAFLLVAMFVLLGLPWTIGLLMRTRVTAQESREAQLVAQRDAEIAERDIIIEQERNQIARDMHDVVAHSLAVVIAQADGARYARMTNPGAVDEGLKAISTTAREALADVRLLLGQLRHRQGEGPQPSLQDLGRLFEQFRASGLVIRHTEVGVPLVLGTGQQLAVYRIIQEALTNVLRHGEIGEPAIVTFTWTATDLEVIITSAITTSPRTGEMRLGHGLAGMKERATLAGGWLTAAPDGTDFVVTASVPAANAGVRA